MECTQFPSSSIPIGSWDTHAPAELTSIDGFTPRRFRKDESVVLQDQRMVQAFKLLGEYNILQAQQVNFCNGRLFSRFMIYAIDNTGGDDSSVPLLGQYRTQVKQALTMVLLNMNVDPWIFSHESEQTPHDYSPTTIFQNDQSKRLLDIYLDMPSPRAPNDPYMNPDIQSPPASVQKILDQALSQDSPKGMQTILYEYQKNSLWKLLRRELCPDYIINPRHIPVLDMNQQSYYINMSENVPRFCRRPTEYWDDVKGGIICEDMGTGKSCLCIALIMQTIHQFSQPPIDATHLYCELYPFAPSSATIVRDITPVNKETILLAPGSTIPTLRELAAASVKMNLVEYGKYRDYINVDTMEVLDSMSVYYYTEESSMKARNPRARQSRVVDPSQEVYLSSSTLVIVPANLADQWCNEVNKHTKHLSLKLLRIDSDDSEIPDHRTLMGYDMVLITQTRFAAEYTPGAYSIRNPKGKSQCQCKQQYILCRCPVQRTISPLMQVRWKRVIVDEGHSLGVKLSDHTLLAEKLHADRRWICTGTPTFNLANLRATPSSSSIDTPVSDKGDLERLSTLMRTFLHIQPYYEHKNIFSSALIKPLVEHHNINTDSASSNPFNEWSLENLSSVSRLRYLMDRIMVRNRPEDVSKDVSLPPLYERIVGLDLEYFQVMTINCYVSIIQANAVLSEREDQDYFFHPSNRKHLSRVIENLKDGCFWNPGGKDFLKTLESTLDNVMQGIQAHQATLGGKYPEDDFQLLKDIRDHLSEALTNDEWRTIQVTQEVGYYCGNLPMIIQQAHALIPASGGPPIFANAQESSASRSIVRVPETRGSENVCVMLANQITNLRSVVQNLAQETRDDNVEQLSIPQSSPNNHPIIIDLDPVENNEELTAFDPARELKLAMSKEQSSRATIICSTSSKLNYIASQILRHQNSEKCIIFCQGQTTLYYIHEYLTLAKVRCLMYHTYGMTKRELSSNIMTFNTSENVSAIIMDIKHGAHGIDLSSASRVYFVSPVWRTDTMRQAVKRAHRIGQIRPVYVETLVINDSLEMAILNRRNEIDNREDLAESNLSTGPELPTSLLGKAKKSNRNGKEILDDRKMMQYIRNITFMPLPARGTSSNRLSSNYLSRKDFSVTATHTYSTHYDQKAFQEDDSKYGSVVNKVTIPFLSLRRNSIAEARPQTQLSHRHYITIRDQEDEPPEMSVPEPSYILIDDDDEDDPTFCKDELMDDTTAVDPLDPTTLKIETSDNITSNDVQEPKIEHGIKRQFKEEKRSTSSAILEQMDTLTLGNQKKEEEGKVLLQDNAKLEGIDDGLERKVKLQPTEDTGVQIKSEIHRPKVEVKNEFTGMVIKGEPEHYVLFDDDGNDVVMKDEEDDKGNIRLKSESEGNSQHGVKLESNDLDSKSAIAKIEDVVNVIQKRSPSLGIRNSEGIEEDSHMSASSSKRVRFA
ncbi:hypothetical protein BGZ49_004900 [Haplosporangium sp. Z 27]|nr:hypothetical protein BGZ49_004900 [Haplosporangium sp. Z 27]